MINYLTVYIQRGSDQGIQFKCIAFRNGAGSVTLLIVFILIRF